jgi:predicted DNA-binding WGR domain protein
MLFDWKQIIENFKVKFDNATNKKYFISHDRIFYKKNIDENTIEVGSYLLNTGWNNGKIDGTTNFKTFDSDSTAEVEFLKLLNQQMKKYNANA